MFSINQACGLFACQKAGLRSLKFKILYGIAAIEIEFAFGKCRPENDLPPKAAGSQSCKAIMPTRDDCQSLDELAEMPEPERSVFSAS